MNRFSTRNVARKPRGEKRVRVMIVDDHAAIRRALRTLLSPEEQVEIVAEAENGAEAIRLANEFRPEVILMDVAMPVIDGIDATRRIKALHPEVRVIGLSMLDGDGVSAMMIEAGAESHLSKSERNRTLVDLICRPRASRS